jgi:hypothetical protein
MANHQTCELGPIPKHSVRRPKKNGWAIVEQQARKGVIASAFVRTDDGGQTWTQLVPRVIVGSG